MNGLMGAAVRRALGRPLRTLLTVLQVALGTLAVTISLNLIQGRMSAVVEPDTFRIMAGYREGNSTLSYTLFTAKDLATLSKLIPDALAMTVERLGGQTLILESKGARYRVLSSSFVGISYPQVTPVALVAGSFFTERDYGGSDQPLVIAESVALTLFGQSNAVGKMLSVGETNYKGIIAPFVPYRVIGVFRDPTPNSAGIGGPYVYAPLNGASSALLVRARPGTAKAVQQQVLNAVLQMYRERASVNGHSNAVYIAPAGKESGNNGSGLDPSVILFSAFGIVILIVCSIGIFSIMLVDIAERTREIGMRRALGARQIDIIVEFLLDAGLMAGSGALVGVLIASLTLPWIQRATGPYLFGNGLVNSPLVALKVVALVLLVGVLLGFYPALLASRLRPVEALREAR